MNARALFGILLLSTLVGCSATESPTAIGDIFAEPLARAVVDETHPEGKDGFHFLPPIGDGGGVDAELDSMAQAMVTICALTDSSCSEEITRFVLDSMDDPDAGRLKMEDGQYHANWKTEDFDLMVGSFYRIAVLVDNAEIGYADVALVESGGGRKMWRGTEYFAVKYGRTLPIKFEIAGDMITPDPDPEPALCDTVRLADPILDAYIRTQVGAETGPLLAEHVATYTSMLLLPLGFSSLDGVECLTALETIAVGQNPITDLSPLLKLPALTFLDLRGSSGIACGDSILAQLQELIPIVLTDCGETTQALQAEAPREISP